MSSALTPYEPLWVFFVGASFMLATSTLVFRPRTDLGRMASGIVIISATLLATFYALLYFDHPIAGLLFWFDFLTPGSLLVILSAALSVGARTKKREKRAVTALLLAANSAIAAVTIVPLILSLAGT